VAANAVPDKVSELFAAYKAKDTARALELNHLLYDFCAACFCEVSPAPIKAALHHMGFCSDELRSPLGTIEEHNRARVVAALEPLLK
jgi:4-hydroxy-tetrahydrodipicolinate synthase